MHSTIMMPHVSFTMNIPGNVVGRFISFEGIDGCGKSTLLQHLSRWLNAVGVSHITTREPGGTRLGESIRELLLDPTYHGMSQEAEVLLYSASRAQLVQEVIGPALRDGIWVLADRFSDATLAYQGYGRGLDLDMLLSLQVWATQGLMPHHTILLDCSLETAAGRRKLKTQNPDRIEGEEHAFHERVRQGYLELARRYPERFLALDAEGSLEEVLTELETLFWLPLRSGLFSRVFFDHQSTE
ncbi:MAG: dTMP kinase [Syntrophobacteraceae bacterium]|nr:dTMP kinase [Syntrophobacteraceae bacterium]